MSDTEQDSKNLDYEAEGASVLEVHETVRREKVLPVSAGREPAGLMVLVLSAIVIAIGGGYLLAYSGGFNESIYTIGEYYQPLPRPPVEGAANLEEDLNWIDQWMKDGKKVYKNCSQCHQDSGVGMGNFPPLTGSEWVNGGTKRLGAILLNGLKGPLKVAGRSYGAEAMQSWAIKSDDEIAQVLTYIRRTFGELPEGDEGVVTAEMIRAARDEYGSRSVEWSESELLAIPADEMLPGAAVDLETGAPLAP